MAELDFMSHERACRTAAIGTAVQVPVTDLQRSGLDFHSRVGNHVTSSLAVYLDYFHLVVFTPHSSFFGIIYLLFCPLFSSLWASFVGFLNPLYIHTTKIRMYTSQVQTGRSSRQHRLRRG